MLRDEAMIVRLSISQWTARKFDKRVTERVANDYQVSSEVGRYRKVLIAEDAIKEIVKVVTEARTFHYTNTLPWDNDGGRILPVKAFEDYSKRMRQLKAEFENAVRSFEGNYDEYRLEAQRRLKGMFRAEDYPSRSEIERKYGFSTDIEPVPDANDFRVNLQSGEIGRIKKELEARVKSRETEAIRDLFVRLNEVVSHFAEKLADKDAIFRDSLVENVIELVNLLPKLNVTDDPGLEALRKETQKKICALEPDTLRKDEKVRGKAAADAKAILDKMAGYIGKK